MEIQVDKSLYETGVRPAIDEFLLKESEKRRDYGAYWSASSAGYCMRKVIFDRLGVDYVTEDARKQKVFAVGHIFHEWMQGITKNAGVSVAQETELVDEKLKIKGHIDDLIQTDNGLVLYDYKTQNSRAFSYKKPGMSYFHRMQLGTYLMMLRQTKSADGDEIEYPVDEARILKISKDDLRMTEEVLYWDDRLEYDVKTYWERLNDYIAREKTPECTCADKEGGFMAKPQYNPYYYNGKPCSYEWYKMWRDNKNV